jgi:DNA recombination protein RmuC
MIDIVLITLLLLILIVLIYRTRKENQKVEYERIITEMQRSFERIERNFREDFKLNREESRAVSKDLREELSVNMEIFRKAFEQGIQSFNQLQREKFAQLDEQQQRMITNTEKRLEEIRVTVDEKLQKTLNERIGQSFRMVSEQLESVQKGLGEMQTLAQDVGGLKRVLSNVKTRGNIGEIQLSMLLEQLLAPEQYDANVRTVKGSSDVVEFAVKLPGKDHTRDFVYLPIDAKFPKDVYEQLLNAYDSSDTQAIDAAGKALETTIRKMAKDISDKYLAPPATTDFGIMFLPFEGIYAEVVRRSSLLEELQRTYKVVVTGPTTLAAKVITETIDPNAKVIFGAIYDEGLKKGEIKITVIAGGFNENTFDREFDKYEIEYYKQVAINKPHIAHNLNGWIYRARYVTNELYQNSNFMIA